MEYTADSNFAVLVMFMPTLQLDSQQTPVQLIRDYSQGKIDLEGIIMLTLWVMVKRPLDLVSC